MNSKVTSNRTLQWYQYIAPTILTPLSLWLWWKVYNGDMKLILVAWLLPIVYAYIVAGIGTNILKVWEFNTRFRLGRFRPHHGFVFGSATAMLAWLCHFDQASSLAGVFKYSFVLATVLGFWNIIYDIKAIQSGILLVYNQPWADGQGPEAITLDYAPWFFGGFGAVYGASIGAAEWMTTNQMFNDSTYLWYLLLMLFLSIAIPVVGYRLRSFRIHGHFGCRPVSRPD